jgi:hypothetical protein
MTDNYDGLFSKRVAEVFVTESADGLTNYDYERIQQRAEEDVVMITESMNSIALKGGVSRPIMASVQELIPAGRPLNSYTNHVSSTNHKFALESLALGIKIAIGVGLIAVLGVAVWYLMRAKAHTISKVNTLRLQVADDMGRLCARAAVMSHVRQVEEVQAQMKAQDWHTGDGMSNDASEAAAIVEEVRVELATVSEDMARLAEAATVEAILESTPGCTQLSAMMLAGDYTSILAGNPSMVTATDDFLAIIDRYVVKVLQKAVSGTVRNEAQVDALLKELEAGNQWETTAKDYHKAIDEWCKKNKVKLAVNNDYSSVWQTFQNLLAAAEGKDFKNKESVALAGVVGPNEVLMAKQSQDKVVTLMADLDGVKQKVESTGLPERLSTETKKMVEQWKPVMQMVEAVFHIVSQEIAVLNLTRNIKGAAISKKVKEVRGKIKRLKTKIVDPKLRGKGKDTALLLEEIDTSNFSEFDKLMSSAQKG